MDPITQQTILSAAGGKKDPLYVDDVFSTYLYTGNGGTQTITNGIDLTGEGGMVWTKSRSAIDHNSITDTVRGNTKRIRTNVNNGENTYTNSVTSFNSDGFSLGNSGQVNGSGVNFASWTFRKAPGFFDVVTYTGNGTAGRTVAHNLGSVPGMIVIKCTSAQDDWTIYHRSLGATKNLRLNATDAERTETDKFNDTEPTATQFTLGSNSLVNGSSQTYVAYIFAHDDAQYGTGGDESIIKCGTWTASGGAASINLGFEPQFVITKIASEAGAWFMFDSMRGMVAEGNDARLRPDLSDAESTGSNFIEPTATGFDIENLGSSQDFIYMAIRRPNKPPEAATEVFAIDTARGTSPSPPQFTSGFVVDWALNKPAIDASNNWLAHSRLTGNSRLYPNSTQVEDTGNTDLFDFMNGYTDSASYDNNNIAYMLKRAPGFFDVVTYTGTGSATTINHNLGAVPSVVLVKGRNTTFSWYWQHYALGANTFLQLNNDEVSAGNGNIFNNTLPTSSVFSLGSLGGTNQSGSTYIAYLFGDLPGVSKAGTYTGNGGSSSFNVDCGFTNGARFVLIKDTTSVNDWYVWDTVRGMTSSAASYLRLNQTAGQSSSDWVETQSTGFKVTTGTNANLRINVSGNTYIFLAIA